MGSEIEISETPNWLKELEAKRERRLKTKLGHELGAGAPCLTCEDKCPGLDLHFWRKICKNCKCSKENHEVQDDDIYGWAQDELLGTKVNRLKRKIVLPGRKDKEVELEWAPNGQKETIDKYLKTVPPELLPIKGSQAAQDRKQMLKKQIPIHDIDPTLCHELTDEELKKMQEYVAHIKQSSVGVGHLIQINFNKGTTHVMDKNDAMFLINNVPKGIISSENVILHGGDNSVPLKNLANKLGNLDLKDKPGLDFYQPNSIGSVEIDERNPMYSSIKDRQYGVNDVIHRNNVQNMKHNILDPVGNRVVTEDVQEPQETCLRDLSYPYNDYPVCEEALPGSQNFNDCLGKTANIKNLVPSAFVPTKQPDDIYNENNQMKNPVVGSVMELPYPSQFINDKLKLQRNLPHYNSGNMHLMEEHQNPAYFQPIKDLAYPTNQNDDLQPDDRLYSHENPYNSMSQGLRVPSSPFRTIEGAAGSPMNSPIHTADRDRLYQPRPQIEMSGNAYMSNPQTADSNFVNYDHDRLQSLGKPNQQLPHLSPAKAVLYENQQSPAKIRNLKDLAYSTYDSPLHGTPDEDFHNLSVKDRLSRLKQKELSVLGPRNSPISDRTLSPSKFSIKDRVMNLTPSFTNPTNPEMQDHSIPYPPSYMGGVQNSLPHMGDVQNSPSYMGGVQNSHSHMGGIQDSVSCMGDMPNSPSHKGGVHNSPSHMADVQNSPSHRGGFPNSPSHRGGVQNSPTHMGDVLNSPSHKGGVQNSPSHMGEVQNSPSHRGGVQNSPSRMGGVQNSPSHRGGVQNLPSHMGGVNSPYSDPRNISIPSQTTGGGFNSPTMDDYGALSGKNTSENVPYSRRIPPEVPSKSAYSTKERQHENLPAFTPGNPNLYEDDLQPSYIPIGSIKDIEYENPDIRMALSKDNDIFEGSTPNKVEPNLNMVNLPCCHYCKEAFKQEELAIAIPERSDALYHTGCFKCHGCNQILADMFYFYDKAGDSIYCGRDYAKIRGIPRCMACDELIFVKEYCLAENCTFHVKHFCCFECDKPLADQNYVMENNQPVCIPCYELTKANKCYACAEVIHPDQQGLQLKDGVHFHATDDCFACKVCKKSLFGAKLLFRKDCLYCSHDCYNSDC